MLAALKPLIAVALLGLMLSALLHVLLISGFGPFSVFTGLLGFGMFLVWIPVCLIAFKLWYPDYDLLNVEPQWKALFYGSPLWLNCLWVSLLVYAMLAPKSAQVSAIFMGFFALALSVLYSVHRQPWYLVGLLCPNGHKVSLDNRFCPTCGTCLPNRQASA